MTAGKDRQHIEVRMSQRQVIVNRCDVCAHEWIPKLGVTYTHCTSGKCRSRLWNSASKPTDVEIAYDVSRRKNIAKLPIAEQAIRSTRREHNPKTCRVYRCGLCAA